MAKGPIADMSDFELGAPALVCRWRLANRHLLLANRHYRALLARKLGDAQVSRELVAWAKQHIEWTLDDGAAACPDGVLMLLVDRAGKAAMTVGPYEPLPDTRLASLARRALQAKAEAKKTLVAPETLWLARGDELMFEMDEGGAPSGACSLVLQLAQTMGIKTNRIDDLLESAAAGTLPFDEAFLVSDEHGIVVASDAGGLHGTRMAQGYQRLQERA